MSSSTLRAGILGLALTAVMAGNAALAEETMFKADLTGSEEVPPVDTGAKGTADVTYDSETKKLSWMVEYSDLSAEPTAAHFYGPAGSGENAPPVVSIEVGLSPIEGSADLTEEQGAALTEGHWYLNIHTDANPNGEIRGHVTHAQ